MLSIWSNLRRFWTPWHLLWGLSPFPYLIFDRLTYVYGAEGCAAENFTSRMGQIFLAMLLPFGIPAIAYLGLFLYVCVLLVSARNRQALIAWFSIPIFMISIFGFMPWDFLRFSFNWSGYEGAMKFERGNKEGETPLFTHFFTVEPCMYFGGAPYSEYQRLLIKRGGEDLDSH